MADFFQAAKTPKILWLTGRRRTYTFQTPPWREANTRAVVHTTNPRDEESALFLKDGVVVSPVKNLCWAAATYPVAPSSVLEAMWNSPLRIFFPIDHRKYHCDLIITLTMKKIACLPFGFLILVHNHRIEIQPQIWPGRSVHTGVAASSVSEPKKLDFPKTAVGLNEC